MSAANEASADQQAPPAATATWPGRWGAISFSAPFLAMLQSLVVTRLLGWQDDATLLVLFWMNTVLVAAGLVIGIAAVVGSVIVGRRGWMARAMLGTLLNAMALFTASAMLGESGL